MSILYGNNDISDIKYNNTTIDSVIYNGIEVYTSTGPLSSFGIDKINSSIIGKVIRINNTRDGEYNEWRVIGINHDGTTDTVDVMKINIITSRYVDGYGTMSTKMMFEDTRYMGSFYSVSNIRKYLNNGYYNAFDDEAKSHIQTMNVDTIDADGNDHVLQEDKVKLISYVELGVEPYKVKLGGTNYYYYALNTEGTKYEYFDTSSKDTKDTKRVITSNSGTNIWYWTRSQYTDYQVPINRDKVCIVSTNGEITIQTYDTEAYVVPIVRLS